MEKALHTPGPWGIPDIGTSRGSVNISAGGPHSDWKGLIAQVDAGNYARSPAEGLANAHLVAAAPELLAALEKVIEKVASCCDCLRASEELKAANTAIAKARGAA